MKIDTTSRPAAIVGIASERKNMIAWFDQYKEFDPQAQIIVEECDVYKEGDLVLYFSSNDTLREIQESMIIAKRKLIRNKPD